MDKLKMHSQDKVKEHIAQIAALFPNVLTETIKDGKVEQAIDFDILKQELSDIVVDGPAERYQFTWPDKKKSILLANAPIAKTLRPYRDESVDFDTTENIYIEGDNLDALKILRETYLKKVTLIFIDPPYNTGNDFLYEDDFRQNLIDYKGQSGQLDEKGNRLFQNTESNGRFHTDWLNMLYPRLKVAKDLLDDDGIILITLDDGENSNTRKMCDEIFGEKNFITEFIWEKKKKPSFLHRNLGKLFDYILCYARNAEDTVPFSVETTTEGKKYPFNNAGNGISILKFPPNSVDFGIKDDVFEPQDMSEGNIHTELLNKIIVKNFKNQNEILLKGEWRYSQNKLDEIVKNNEQISISKIPFRPNHIKAGGEIKKMKNILSSTHYNCETNEDGTEQIISLFGSEVFDTPKPIKLIKLLTQAITYSKQDAIILDFFAGSATTAHAVMELNNEDSGKRKFIIIQLPEETTKDTEAYRAGFKNISEIGKERIRRAGTRIKKKSGLLAKNLDTGFRVLKVDNTNMEDVYYTPGSYQQNFLNSLADNIKPDRSAEDLLFQVMLDLGILLSSSIQEILVGGKKVYNVADGYLLACFDNNVNSETVTEIAKREPYYAIFRDSSMSDDSVATNFDQIFATYSPTTVRKVL